MTALQLVISNWGRKWFMVTPLKRNLDCIFYRLYFRTKHINLMLCAWIFFLMLWGVMFGELFNGCRCKTRRENNNGLVAHAKDKHTCGRTRNVTSWMKNRKVVIMQTHKERTIWQYQTQCWLLAHCDSNLCMCVCVCAHVSMNVNTCSACMGECVWTPTGCDSVQVYVCYLFCFTKTLLCAHAHTYTHVFICCVKKA